MSFELKKYRNKAGLTQRQLADAVGVKHNTISNWESGITSPDTDAVYLLCNVLKISADKLLGTTGLGLMELDARLSPEEVGLINNFRDLNDKGQRIIAEHVDDLVASGKYKKGDTNSSVSSIA